MNRHAGFVLLATLLMLTLQANAADPNQSLPAWERLTPAQRDLLVAPVRERWNTRPADRARMLRHAERWERMSPEQRSKMRHGVDRWEGMPPEQRAEARLIFQHMRALSPSERASLRARLKAMTPEQRRAWLKAQPHPTQNPGDRARGRLEAQRAQAEPSGR